MKTRAASRSTQLAGLKAITDQRIARVNDMLKAAGEKPVADSH